MLIKKNLWAVLFAIGLFSAGNVQAKSGTPSEPPQPQATQTASETCKGTVFDAEGEPLVGATIRIDGTSIAVAANIDGEFSISGIKKGSKLTISYIGCKPQTVEWNGEPLHIVLESDGNVLSEVVVAAFGSTQRKETITGSIQQVNPESLKMPSANLSNSFAGRLSGVVAYQRSGEPGSNGSNFYIRGISTISGTTNPLIVLDGVEISQADLNALDPDVIESFSILKDATATAMYGSRGANGVMIVKTKSGGDLEKPAITIRAESYINTPTKIQKFVDGPTYMQMYNEAITNQGTGDILFTKDQIAKTAAGANKYIYPNVNWYDEIFKEVTWNQKANFNIRGGTQKITYFMNASFNHETGMMKNVSKNYYSYGNNIDLMKYAFQNNIDFHLSKTSTISLHLNTQLNNYSGPYNSVANIFGSIMQNNPVDFPISYPNELAGDGNWPHWGKYNGGNGQGGNNPMAYATAGTNDYFESTVIANIDFAQKLDFITPGLEFRALLSFKNWSYTNRYRYQSATNSYIISDYTENPDGTYDITISPMDNPTKPILTTSNGTTGDRRYYFQAYFNYNRSFENNNIGAMVLMDMNSYNVNAPGNLIESLPQRKMGFAARVTYDYARKYMVEVNAGYTGSENFAAGHRWGFFPSISAGWRVSGESWWEPVSRVISNLKLRASYGLVGNDQVGSGRYVYLAQVNLQGSNAFKTGYGNNTSEMSGPTYTRFQNDGLTWEVGHKLNLGLDLQLGNFVNITVEGFQEIRRNIFQSKTSNPNYFGTSNTQIYGNLAEVKNWGIDAAVDGTKQFGKDLLVSLKGTFTFARNKITKYDEGAGTVNALKNVGKKLNTIYGYVSNGLYIDYADILNNPTSTLGNIAIAPGDIKYVDQPDNNGNYDGLITANDRVAMGYPTVPEIVYGFGPSIIYKNWDFSFFFQGVANTSMMISGFEPFGTQYNRNVLSWIAKDYWSQSNQNPNASYPRLTKYNNNNNTAASDFWLRDASFLKLKNVEVGFTYKIARVYLSAINLCTFSKFKLWDPEMGGGAGLSYPTQRTFSLGVQLNL